MHSKANLSSVALGDLPFWCIAPQVGSFCHLMDHMPFSLQLTSHPATSKHNIVVISLE